MKSKKDRNLGWLLMICVMISIIAAVVLFGTKKEKNSNKSQVSKVTVNGSNQMPIDTRQDKKEKFKMMAASFKNALEKGSESQANEGVDTENFDLVEASARRVELSDKTNPYYWEMVPIVVEEMWKNGPEDIEWNDAVQKAADELIPKGKYKGTEVTDVSCRQPLCKIEFVHTDESSYSSFYDGDMDNGPWLGGAGHSFGGYKRLDNGDIASFIYFTKEGDFETFFKVREVIAKRKNIELDYLKE